MMNMIKFIKKKKWINFVVVFLLFFLLFIQKKIIINTNTPKYTPTQKHPTTLPTLLTPPPSHKLQFLFSQTLQKSSNLKHQKIISFQFSPPSSSPSSPSPPSSNPQPLPYPYSSFLSLSLSLSLSFPLSFPFSKLFIDPY